MSHEPQNLHARTIRRAGMVLAGSAMTVLVIGYLLWNDWAASAPQVAHVPRAPRLQPAPRDDLQAYRSEQARHNTWQWMDAEHRVARVPVDRAMRLMAEGQKR